MRICLLATCLLVTACGTGLESGQSSDASEGLPLGEPNPEAKGQLLFTRNSEIWRIEPGTGTTELVEEFPAGQFVGGVNASPDGTRVAFSLYQPGEADETPGGTDLYVIGPDGSEPERVLAHDAPSATLGDPAWGPAGEFLYFTYRDPDGTTAIERVRLDGSGRERVIENAHTPTIANGDQLLAFLRTDPETEADRIWVAGLDGSNARELLDGSDFQAIINPRFSPDGSRLLFVAVGGPDGSAGRTKKPMFALFDPLRPRTARAHGQPHDLWTIDADGSNLQRLTNIGEYEPAAAWSPDGRWIAMVGERGIYLIDPDTREATRFAEEQARGALTWVDSW